VVKYCEDKQLILTLAQETLFILMFSRQ
jgi:hypothetical protein